MKKTLFLALGVALLLTGAACGKKATKENTSTTNQGTGTLLANSSDRNVNDTQNSSTDTSSVRWDNTATGWMAFGTPPACPEPFTILSPVELSRVTAILYPGQSRPDYKPHGGFRFDVALDTNVPYFSPVSGTVIRGARYLTDGEIQYTFDIVHPCGMMVRVGHLRELAPKFQAIADAFPAESEGDSRTTRIDPPVSIERGELIATHIGLRAKTLNVFADLGLFDLRTKNKKSQDAAWAASHSPELDQYAVCWFDYLPADDEATVRALPAGDPKVGKTSDFCTS